MYLFVNQNLVKYDFFEIFNYVEIISLKNISFPKAF